MPKQTSLPFVVIGPTGVPYAQSVAFDERGAIRRFMQIDGAGRFMMQGWTQALREGFMVEQIEMTLEYGKPPSSYAEYIPR